MRRSSEAGRGKRLAHRFSFSGDISRLARIDRSKKIHKIQQLAHKWITPSNAFRETDGDTLWHGCSPRVGTERHYTLPFGDISWLRRRHLIPSSLILGGTTLRDWAPCAPWCYRKMYEMRDEGVVLTTTGLPHASCETSFAISPASYLPVRSLLRTQTLPRTVTFPEFSRPWCSFRSLARPVHW